MKTYKIKILFAAIFASLLFVGCSDDDDGPRFEEALDFSGTYAQEDHMGRPGINTVFGSSDDVKNRFNTSITSNRATFQPTFQATLELYHDVYGDALNLDLDYEANIFGFDAATFTTVLAQFDALQVSPTGVTAYFVEGGVALTGRRLEDDVIDVSLTLMFGGDDGARFDGTGGTPQLTSDGVGPGDRNFSLPFPYLETPN